MKKNAKNKEKAEILSNSINDLKLVIEKSTKEVKNYKEDEEEKNNKLNLLESKLFEYNKQNENLIKRIKVEQKLEEVTNKVKNFEKFYNNISLQINGF
ncbi:MAG: hypothetical protein RBR53_08075 [Desulforegulaceae bacterium]|nr:hypothetical protein [Desulforegulaceae bacterium]